jgi:hypothetical protein
VRVVARLMMFWTALGLMGCTTKGQAYHSTTCVLPMGGFISIVVYARTETEELKALHKWLDRCEDLNTIPPIPMGHMENN